MAQGDPEYLELENLLRIAERLGVPGVRDIGLLASAAGRPQTTAFGRDAYPSMWEKAAVLMESIVRNHPLVDGNRRAGWQAAVIFLGINGIPVDAPEDGAYDLVIGVATGRIEYAESAAELARWAATRDGAAGTT